jgi:DNA polymerase-3 subunit epsilon
MKLTPQKLIFIDFEASGLGPDSWPIEVGLAWIENDTVEKWSSLICPEPNWDENAWSSQSASVHKIQREELRSAPSAADVASDLLHRIYGKHVVSDAVAHDHWWAELLLEPLDFQPPPFASIEKVITAACKGNSALIHHVHAQLNGTPRPHRAGPDEARLAEAILLAMKLRTEN